VVAMASVKTGAGRARARGVSYDCFDYRRVRFCREEPVGVFGREGA